MNIKQLNHEKPTMLSELAASKGFHMPGLLELARLAELWHRLALEEAHRFLTPAR